MVRVPPLWLLISIHAPREGSDAALRVRVCLLEGISIHAPREGSDEPMIRQCKALAEFQSTLPVRGAT